MDEIKLKIGLLVEGTELAAWEHRMVKLIREGNHADIAVVIRRIPTGEEHYAACSGDANWPVARDRDGWGRPLRRMALAVQDLLINKPGFLPNALQSVDATNLLAGIDVIELSATRGKSSDWIQEGVIADLRSRNLDVLVRLGCRPTPGEFPHLARLGVWSCEIGDDRTSHSGPAGYWEVMESRPEIVSTLKIEIANSALSQVAYRSLSSTNVMSLQDSTSTVLWKSLQFIPRKLKQAREEGEVKFLAGLESDNARPRFYDRPKREIPALSELCALVCRKALQKCVRKWEEIFYLKQWFLLYDKQDRMSSDLSRFKRITPPKDRFWADPFVVARDGRFYVFIEECFYADRKGHISAFELRKDGSMDLPVRVLDTPYHLSYPFVFEFEGELFMIPESAANRTVDLYRCTSFPYRWEFQKHLRKDLHAVDTTLIEWQGKWWMFANEIETKGASTWDELFLYWADSPVSDDWTPHPMNPIVSDVRSARPAGRLFVRNGRLYRPSQNCAGHYGYGFNISEVVSLTENDYREVVVESIEPKWDEDIISTHTLNHEEGLTIIDGQLRRRK